MPNPLINNSFSSEKPVYCRRPMTANGHKFNAGDLFPWRKMCVSLRRVSQLFASGKLMHQEVPAILDEPVEEVKEPVAKKVTKKKVVAKKAN